MQGSFWDSEEVSRFHEQLIQESTVETGKFHLPYPWPSCCSYNEPSVSVPYLLQWVSQHTTHWMPICCGTWLPSLRHPSPTPPPFSLNFIILSMINYYRLGIIARVSHAWCGEGPPASLRNSIRGFTGASKT